MTRTHEIKDFGVTFGETTLSSGVKIYSFYRKNTPVYFTAHFYAGSQYDDLHPGLAHFAEHLYASGTTKYPNKNILNEYIQGLGAMKNAYTSKQVSGLEINFTDKKDSSEIFEVIDQMLNNSTFTEENINIERGAVMAEQTRGKSIPATYVRSLASSILFQGTNLERSVLGDEKIIQESGKKELEEFYDKYIKNGEVAYFIGGDFDLELVTKNLESINCNRKPIPLNRKKLPVFSSKKELIDTRKGEQNYISLVSRIQVSENKKEDVASSVASVIFGIGPTSRLFKKLRVEKGWVYDISGSMYSNCEYGSIMINTNCKVKDSRAVISEIKSELEKFYKDGVTEKELSLAKKSMLRNIKFGSQTMGWWVDNSIDTLISDSDYILVDELILIINSITINDINSFLKKYLVGTELLLAGVGDFS